MTVSNLAMKPSLDAGWDPSLILNFGYTPSRDEIEAVAVTAIDSGIIDPATPTGQVLGNRHALSTPSSLVINQIVGAAVESDACRRIVGWLRDLFEPHHVVEVTGIPAAGGRFSVYGRLGEPKEHALIEQFLATHWGRVNLYYGVNPRFETKLGQRNPASKGDVASRHLVVFDHDNAPSDIDERRAWELEMLAKHPNQHVASVVRSGNGLQVILRVQEEVGNDLVQSRGAVLQSMYHAVGADAQVHNADRVFRLPFTSNIPSKSKRDKGRVMAVTSVMELPNA